MTRTTGNQEDVHVVEALLMLKRKVKNLFVLHERTAPVLHQKVRLFGLGGAIHNHKLFDHGDGEGIAAGSSGAMWTTMLQVFLALSGFRQLEWKEIPTCLC
jgi:hypothetical protein